MKIHDPRFLLTAGLAFAFSLNGSQGLQARGTAKSASVRIAQVPPDLSQTPAPLSAPVTPGQLQSPDWKPTPLSPVPGSPPPLNPVPNPDPAPSSTVAPPVTTVPMQQGTQPRLSPNNRPPMGMFYREQERLEGRDQPPRPLPTVPYPGPPPKQLDLDVPPSSSQQGVDRFGFAPPPGTLGQTYKRRTRVIDDKKHPRVGIVEVHLPEGVDVTAVGLKSKWTGKVWQLESEPLLPGIPQIYEIKASWGEDLEPHVRTVRLIMGRVVEVDF